MQVNQFFNCFFDKVGFSTGKKIHGSFQIANITPIIKVNIGNSTIDDPNANKLYAVSGILKGTINGQDSILAGANIYFFKNIISEFVDFSQTEHIGLIHNHPVYDFCKTDLNGEYSVFLEPGLYHIKIENGKYNDYVYNKEVIGGLNNQYYFIPQNFTIKQRYEDIIELNNLNYKLISGYLYNQYNKPIENAEIIITQGNEVISYIKTKKDGKYQFLLLNGTYDVRIRHIDYSIKIINDFQFENNKGFMNEIQKKYSWFKKNNWLTIK